MFLTRYCTFQMVVQQNTKTEIFFINLCHHFEDFNVPAEWHFFATSHGKTAADGVAGTLKRLATKASLQHPDGSQILSAKQLFEFAVREIKGISFCYVTSNEHREEADHLRDRFDRSKQYQELRSSTTLSQWIN